MPYIKNDQREIDVPIDRGTANYLITKAMIAYVETHGVSYQTLSEAFRQAPAFARTLDASQMWEGDLQAATTDAQNEFYRRLVAPYEDKKIKENGDVYPTELLKKVL